MRYITDSATPSTRQDKPDPTNTKGELYKVTADTLWDLRQIYKDARRGREHASDKGPRWVPTSNRLFYQVRDRWTVKFSEEYRTRAQPVIAVDSAVQEEAIAQLDLLEIPESYFRVATAKLKLEIFCDLWHQEEERGRPEESEVSLEQIQKFLGGKLRYWVVQLLDAGEWIDEPEAYSTHEAQQQAIKHLNQYMQQVDLGRQNHLPFSSDAEGKRKLFGKQPETKDLLNWLANPRVIAYQTATPEQQQLMLQNDGALLYCLQQAGLKP